MTFSRLHYLFIIGLLGLIILSVSGRFLALGDSLAVFRPHMLIVLAVFVLALRSKRWKWMALIAIGLVLAFHFRHGFASALKTETSYAVYQKNLYFRIQDVGPVAEDIRKLKNLDFVTLQEITDAKQGLMAELKSEFPYQHICPFASVGGTAVLSRWPINQGSQKCFDGGGMSVIQVDKGLGPIWVISTHLNWPYPYSQRQQVQRLLPQLQSLDGPVIIGGDFNMVPWSYTVRSFEKTASTKRLAGTLTTFHMGHFSLLGLPIDHVLGPEICDGQTQRRPKLGSDHHGVYAQIACP